ncbi:type IV secretion system protein VirB10 [Bartonella sp. B41]
MTDEMDEISIDDRDTIRDGKRKNAHLNLGKVVAGFVLLCVCCYLVYSMLPEEKKQFIEIPKETVIKQTEFFQPQRSKPEPLELVEQDKSLLPKVELPTPQIGQSSSDNSLLEAAQRAPVLAYAATNQRQVKARADNDGAELNKTENRDDDGIKRFNHLLKPTILEGIRASALGNRNYIMTMGAFIPCILETAISSDQQGFVSCIVARDILSDNGRVVLLDKGTQIVGEYRAGLKKGQNRLFVLWTRAKTPNGIIITLASPATDSLGRSGVDGDIDNHWFERISSALFLSIVKIGTRYASRRLSGEAETKDSEITSSGQNIANILVENYLHIPPTLNKNQGEMVNVFVARDLDFSNVYRLKVVESKKRILNRAISGNFHKNFGGPLK